MLALFSLAAHLLALWQVDEAGNIIDSKFKTFGCGSAIASSSLATEWVKGRTIDDAVRGGFSPCTSVQTEFEVWRNSARPVTIIIVRA